MEIFVTFFIDYFKLTYFFYENISSMDFHQYTSIYIDYRRNFSSSKINYTPADKNRVPYFEIKLQHTCARFKIFLNKIHGCGVDTFLFLNL